MITGENKPKAFITDPLWLLSSVTLPPSLAVVFISHQRNITKRRQKQKERTITLHPTEDRKD